MALSTVEILVNGEICDFEKLTSLPISFSKEVDDILNVVGAKGLDIDQIANSITLPGTKRNESVFLQINHSLTVGGPIGLVDVLIRVDSQIAYSGKGALSLVKNMGNMPKKYTLQLFPDMFSIFPQLQDTKLCDIDLGIIQSSLGAIAAGWSDPNQVAVFPPVIYGEKELVNYRKWKINELRPQIKIWWIVNRLFQSALGYSIASNMLQSDFFRRLCYLFVSGRKWKRADDITANVLEVNRTVTAIITRLSPSQVFYPLNLNNIVVNGTAPLQQWFSNTTFRPTKAGWYRFRVRVNSPQTTQLIQIVSFIYDPGTGTLTEDVIELIPVNADWISQPIFFQPLDGRTFLQIRVGIANVGGSFVYNFAELKSELLDEGVTGYPINLASCMPCDSSADFFLGLLHLIGGVAKFDVINRVVSFENRFYNPTQTPQTGYAGGNSWYQFPVQNNNLWESEIEADQRDISERLIRLFGDKLNLAYKTSADPLQKYWSENEITSGFDWGLISVDFEPTGIPEKSVRNPYFTEIVNFQGVGGVFPSALPQLPKKITTLQFEMPEATYQAEPKIGYYHGIVSWLNSSDTSLGWFFPADSVNLVPTRSYPCLFTRFPYVAPAVFGVNFYELPNGFFRPNICFNDTEYPYFLAPNILQTRVIRGLARLFYLEFVAIMRKGRQVEVETVLNYDEFRADDFRKIRRLRKYSESVLVLVHKIDKFEPLKSRKAKLVGLVAKMPTQDDLDAIKFDNSPLVFDVRDFLFNT